MARLAGAAILAAMPVTLFPRIVLAALGLAATAWCARAWLEPAPAVGRPALAALVPPPVAVPRPGPAGAERAARDAEPPPGMTRARWQALQAELGAQPGGAAEIARIARYLTWAELLRRFRDTPDGAERQRLALALDAGLAERLHAGEVSAAEARQIKAAILEAMPGDPAARAAAVQRWIAAEVGPAPATDARQVPFERRQAEIVAVWSAQPPAMRDRVALERELDMLRREHFATGPASPGGPAR